MRPRAPKAGTFQQSFAAGQRIAAAVPRDQIIGCEQAIDGLLRRLLLVALVLGGARHRPAALRLAVGEVLPVSTCGGGRIRWSALRVSGLGLRALRLARLLLVALLLGAAGHALAALGLAVREALR